MTRSYEKWRPITGWEGHYEISNCGRVRSLDRTIQTAGGYKRWAEGRIRKPSVRDDGYLRIVLCCNCKQERRKIHHLVLEAFVGPRPLGMQCRHLDGNQTNNHLGNLAWGTIRENADDRVCHGRMPRGEHHKLSRFSEAEVRMIRARAVPGSRSDGYNAIAREFGVSHATIWLIATGRTWAHIQTEKS